MGKLGKFINSIFQPSAAPARGHQPAPTPPEYKGSTRVGEEPAWLYAGSPGQLNIATVYRCVQLLSQSVAMLPLEYMRMDDQGIFKPQRGGHFWYLFNVQPCPWLSSFDMIDQLVSDILLWGNAYIVPVYSAATMRYERMQLVRPYAVTHDLETDTYEISDVENGIYGTFSEDEIIHIKGKGSNPKHGLSVITYARQTLAITRTSEAETYERLANGGSVRGVVGNDRTVRGVGKNQDQQLSFVAMDIDERFRNGQRIVHLPGMVDFKQLSMSSADLQFLQTRSFQVREICRFFGVHPSFVFDDTSNNYKSAEMANAAFLSNTLNPLLCKIEKEISRKLILPEHAGFRKFQFDRESLFACDLASRMDYRSKMLGCGMATVNELRAMEGRDPVDMGDAPLVSANLRRLDDPNDKSTKPDNDNEQE